MVLDPLLVWLAAAALAVLFAHAALAKLADLALAEQHLAAYGVPPPLLAVLARGLALLEAATAVALLSPWRTGGAALAAGLLLVYGAAMAWHRARGHALDCGCGGEPLALSWALVLRNLLLAGLALVAARPLAARALVLGDFFVIAGGLVLATLLYAAFHQVLRHRARIETLGRA